MSGIEIVIGVVLGLIVNEATDLSPWLGRVLVRWAAGLEYAEDHPQRPVRTEELQALITVRPGKLLKLLTGMGFLSAAVLTRLRRLVGSDSDGSLAEALPPREYREDEPTTLVARYLFPTERYRGEWKRHWINVVKSGSIILLYGVLGVWVTQLRIKPQYAGFLTAAICVATLFLIAYRFLGWWFDRFVITNKRVMMTRGILWRRVRMVPLLRVVDIQYNQTVLGRLLSYGSFTSSDRTTRRTISQLRDLPNPNELYLRLLEEMYEPTAVEARLGVDDEDGEPAAPATDEVIAGLEKLILSIESLIVALGRSER
ncbi:PH domain-containing protein [Actinoplanes sp. NPDC049668]|uniref:PH domain-containing protein n=1 Tax=unclassified Actinoplanes TaxID=2626549 RepID=UPI0033BB5BF0